MFVLGGQLAQDLRRGVGRGIVTENVLVVVGRKLAREQFADGRAAVLDVVRLVVARGDDADELALAA